MLQPKYSPIHYHHASKMLTDSFTLLTWNMNKRTLDIHASHYSKTIIAEESVDIIALQEAKANKEAHLLYSFPSVMSPNIQRGENLYGVQTATNHLFKAYRQHITDTKESFWATKKSALVTQHFFDDETCVTVVNMHAINFVMHRQYKKEFFRIVETIRDIEGPLILCGDFNPWNKKRYVTMMHYVKELGLKEVVFDPQKHIKRFNRQPLDYVFYRGLSVEAQKVLNITTISDHNPLIVKFRRISP